LTDGCHFNGKIRLMEKAFDLPLAVAKSTVWSVWNDLFHPDAPAEFIHHAFDVMTFCKWHTFLVLTKRPERIYPVLYGAPGWYLGGGDYLPNVWLGTSVESQDYVRRLDYLRPLAEGGWHTFVSCEPCLSAIDLRKYMYHNQQWQDDEGDWHDVDVPGMLHWVIVGAETGPGARPMDPEWARSIASQCKAAGVPLFVKALSGHAPIPPDLQVRQLPW
jgi:protein gp37